MRQNLDAKDSSFGISHILRFKQQRSKLIIANLLRALQVFAANDQLLVGSYKSFLIDAFFAAGLSLLRNLIHQAHHMDEDHEDHK